MRLVRSAAFALALSALPSIAYAEPSASQLAERRRLIAETLRASNAGDHATALEAAQRAMEIHPTASVRLLIANEYLALGQLANALSEAEQCAREAPLDTSEGNAQAVASQCRTTVNQARSRAGRVVVTVPYPRPQGLQVMVNGQPLDRGHLGSSVVAMPGDTVIEASAPGFAPFRQSVLVTGGTTTNVRVSLAPIAGANIGPVAGGIGIRPPGPLVPDPRAQTMRSVGVTALVIGGLAALGGVSLYLTVGEIYDECDPRGSCSHSRWETGRSRNITSLVLLWGGVGVAGLGLLTASLGPVFFPPSPQRVGVTGWWFDPQTAGLTGRF